MQEAIKHSNCLIIYKFRSISVHLHRKKPREGTSADAMDGKLTKISKRIAGRVEQGSGPVTHSRVETTIK